MHRGSRLAIERSERIYFALLSLYPARFRVRFAPEMMLLFRDCFRDISETGQVAWIAAFWSRALCDLTLSILRERARELAVPVGAEHPLIRAVDLLLIPSMVTANLAALGPILTLMLGGAGIPYDRFATTSAFFSIVAGVLAVAASVVLSRLRPTARLWVKLSA